MKSGSDPNKAAMKAQKEQMKRLDGIDLPELQEYILQSPELVGLLDAEQLDDTRLGDIQTDSRLKANQMKALDSLAQRSEEGLTVEDKYAMDQLLGDVNNNEKAQRASIEQEMARRGMDTSGLSMMSKLQNTQSNANEARDRAMQIAMGASQNKQQALSNLAQQSAQMEQADYSRQANVASARDAIMKANAMNRQNVNSANLGARQSIANQRTNTANQQSQVGNQLAQQRFNNEISKASGQGSVANSMSNIAGNAQAKPGGLQSALSGASTGASIGSIVPGVGTGIGAGIGAGVGLLSSFEDGGIARYNGGGVVPFKQAWQNARDAQGGDGGEFEWNGKRYTTNDVVREPQTSQVPVMSTPVEQSNGPDISGIINADKFKNLTDSSTSVDQKLENIENTKIGIDNDRLSGEAQDLVSARDVMEDKKPSGEGFDVQKGLQALSGLIGKPAARKNIKLGNFSMNKPQNVMEGVGPSNYANPFASANFEDGGTVRAEDGSLMFTSDGEGDIVDGESFERDRVDAKLNSGEAVLNVAQQQRLMDLIKGQISPNELGDSDIVEGVPKDYQEDLLGDIENGDDVESKGFNKLLKMLGK